MAIGNQGLSIFDTLLADDKLKNYKSVIELGSQKMNSDAQSRARFILSKHKEKLSGENIDKDSFITPKKFYRNIGFEKYDSIDSDGNEGAKIFDLNTIIKNEYNFDKTYDLVTNFGTSEHIFNQNNVFENMHNLTGKNGLMIHMLPFEGHINHCYFNYHPNLFYDLAIHNDYEIHGFYYFSYRPTKYFRTYHGMNYIKPLKYNNDLLFYLAKLENKGKLLISRFSGSELCVIYKKINNNKFFSPFDEQFGTIDTKLKNNYKKTRVRPDMPGYATYSELNEKVLSELDINRNVNHEQQVLEILGNTYWKVILKKLFFEKKYRRKFIAKIFYKIFGYKSRYLSNDTIWWG